MKETIKNLKFAWFYAKNEKWKIIKYIIANLIEVIISIIIPIISAKMIIMLTNNNLYQLVLMAIVIFIIENIRNFVHYNNRYYANVVYRETLKKLQIDLGKNIFKLENKIVDDNSSGLFIQRLSSDTTRIADIFNTLNMNLSNVITDIGIFVAIFILSKVVFLYLVIFTIILYFNEQRRIKLRNIKDKEYRKEQEKVTGFVGEIVRGVRDIKMLNSEDSFMNELSVKINKLNESRYKMVDVDRRYRLLGGFCRDLSDLLLIILLVILIDKYSLAVASALIIHNYSGRITYIINSVSFMLENLKDFNLSCERIFDILDDNKFSKEKFGTRHIEKVEGNFEFKDVCFGYDKINFLKNLSFKINANEIVAFVGKSGVGKTTIFNLLCKMYEVNSGTITIDGININELDKDSIRGNITIISQNPYIFNMSIRDNFKLVKSDLTDKEMKEACKIACLDEFIKSLPNKYDTIIGEGGINLSGGQKQRLAIARALVQKTEIILFDEATSALDNETQTKIQEAIDNMKNQYTILIIAHRLSTIKNADRILYLEDGKVVAEGTHNELLKKCLGYKKLYESEKIEK